MPLALSSKRELYKCTPYKQKLLKMPKEFFLSGPPINAFAEDIDSSLSGKFKSLKAKKVPLLHAMQNVLSHQLRLVNGENAGLYITVAYNYRVVGKQSSEMY